MPSNPARLALVLTAAGLALALFPPLARGVGNDVAISGFTLIQDKGASRWEIRAREARYDGEKIVILDKVDARLLEGDNARITVTAREGRYLADSQTLHLKGDIRARTETGYAFRSSRLEWQGARSLILGPDGIEIEYRGIVFTGKTFSHDVSLGRTLVKDGVRAILTGDPRKETL